jgi:hypothetical protein
MIGSFASFVSYPLVENCPSGARCVDMLAEQVISQVQRCNILQAIELIDCCRYDKLDLNPVIELAVSGNDESVVDEFITSIQVSGDSRISDLVLPQLTHALVYVLLVVGSFTRWLLRN